MIDYKSDTLVTIQENERIDEIQMNQVNEILSNLEKNNLNYCPVCGCDFEPEHKLIAEMSINRGATSIIALIVRCSNCYRELVNTGQAIFDWN